MSDHNFLYPESDATLDEAISKATSPEEVRELSTRYLEQHRVLEADDKGTLHVNQRAVLESGIATTAREFPQTAKDFTVSSPAIEEALEAINDPSLLSQALHDSLREHPVQMPTPAQREIPADLVEPVPEGLKNSEVVLRTVYVGRDGRHRVDVWARTEADLQRKIARVCSAYEGK
jgi:hypothetical protein